MQFRSLIAATAAALAFPAMASAHATISPAASLSGKLQLYSLAVPTEKDKVTTTKVVMTVPNGFSIDSFAPSPGWTRTSQQSGTGNNSVITQVTWTGGKVPTGEDSLFQFLAQPASTGTLKFTVQQTFSDGSIVNWSGSESSDSPAPTIEVDKSLSGSGTSALTIVALIVGALGLLAGGFALLGGGGNGRRPLA
jgi:uncharacterized protein YcnI